MVLSKPSGRRAEASWSTYLAECELEAVEAAREAVSEQAGRVLSRPDFLLVLVRPVLEAAARSRDGLRARLALRELARPKEGPAYTPGRPPRVRPAPSRVVEFEPAGAYRVRRGRKGGKPS